MVATVLVTGGAGYIGSHTCLVLLEAGYSVIVIDNLSNSQYESLVRVQKITGKTITFIEPSDLKTEVLITYPVDHSKLDIFTRFLEPEDIDPLSVRTSEMTVMMVQLVASNRGVCCLPNWALHEYSSRGYVKAKRLGISGLQATLYAAIRDDMFDAPFMHRLPNFLDYHWDVCNHTQQR